MESNYSEMDVSCSLQHFPVLSSVSLTLYVRASRLRSRGGGRGGEGDVLHRSEWVMMVGLRPRSRLQLDSTVLARRPELVVLRSQVAKRQPHTVHREVCLRLLHAACGQLCPATLDDG